MTSPVTEHPLSLSFNAYPAQTSPAAAAAAAAAVVVSTQPVEAGRALTVDEPSSGQLSLSAARNAASPLATAAAAAAQHCWAGEARFV